MVDVELSWWELRSGCRRHAKLRESHFTLLALTKESVLLSGVARSPK